MELTRRRTVALLVLAAVPATLEAAIVAAIGFQAVRGLAPQATAVWPYHTYHDMRWLLVYHNSLPGFAVELLVVILARGLLSAMLVALSWPAEVARPALRRLVKRNIEVAALTALIVSPWAALSVAFSVVAVSWYLFASLIPMVLLSPFLIRAGAVAHWWRGLPSVELLGWSALNFGMLTVAGALAASVPAWWAVPVAAAAGVANGLLRRQTVHEAVLPRPERWARVPVAPLAIALTMIAAVAAQAFIGVNAGGQREWRPPIVSEGLPEGVRHAVIAIAGHDSSWNGRPAADPRVERFSYRGLDDQQRPLPYEPKATHRSLGSSAALLAAHVAAVHRRTGLPVALLGASEGAMVISTYLERRPDTPVDVAMLFSPLVRPGRAYYPPPGHSGWGVVAGWELRAIFALANLPRTVKDSPDEPFVRSVLANAPFYRNRTLCPVAGVRMIAFLPTVSAAEAPPGEYARIPVVQLPAFHGGIVGREVARDRVIDVLVGESVGHLRPEYPLLQRLGAAWQAPPLAERLNPVWRAARESDPAFTGHICQGR